MRSRSSSIVGIVWVVIGLIVASGHDRKGGLVGVPYGSMARLILLYLQTEAVRSGTGRYLRTPWERIAKMIDKITEQVRQMGGTKALLQRDAIARMALMSLASRVWMVTEIM